MDVPRFYQILGYRGHFKADFWQWEPGRRPDHFHEFAHEKPAAEAIAGRDSTLYVDSPVDATGSSTERAVELNLGIRPWGAMSLLVDKETFKQHIARLAGIRGPTGRLPPAYPTSNYLSISPIKFKSENELTEFFESIRTKNPNKSGQDDSKMNNNYSERTPNRGRAEFEQARLLYYAWFGKRHNLLPSYGLPPLSPRLRFAYLAFTPWIDPHSYNINPNEEEPVLDIGWHEVECKTTRHIVIEEYDSMTKQSLPKAKFTYGQSETHSESALSSILSSLLSPTISSGPLILVVYDWSRTARLLKSHGVDTNGKHWHIGIGELLGLERPLGKNGIPHRDEYQAPRPQYRRRDPDEPLNETKPKTEPNTESKPFAGRWDTSSSIRKRSLSPRSRPRPLADQTERKYQRPLFDPEPDDGEKEGDQRSSSPPAPDCNRPNPATEETEIYVIDLRHLFSIVLNTPEPRDYILYPPCARRLGFEFDGWCAGNQAAQMPTLLEWLVGGEPIHKRQAQLKAQPGLPNPVQPASTKTPIILEGKAGQTRAKMPIRPDYQYDHDDDDDDDW